MHILPCMVIYWIKIEKHIILYICNTIKYIILMNNSRCYLNILSKTGTIVSGEDFNKHCKDEKFNKIINENYSSNIDNKFFYKLGLNTDIHKLTTDSCSKGGLYFSHNTNIHNFFGYGDLQVDVNIPNDTKLYIGDGKLKAQDIIISNPISHTGVVINKINNIISRDDDEDIEKNDELVELVKSLNKKELLYVILINCRILKICEQTDELCMQAVKQNGYALEFVKNQTDELCMQAVKQNGCSLKYVKNQTDELCIEAVKQNGYSLIFVKNQTNEICMEAVKQYGWSLKYVKNQTDELCMEAVKQNGYSLIFVKNQTYEICIEAVKQNRESIKYINNYFTYFIIYHNLNN